MHALVIDLAAKGHLALCLRLFADHVEGAAGIATTIQAGGWAAQYFQAFNRVGVGGIGVATVDRETVTVKLAGGETTYGKGGQALAAKVVGPADATGVVQRVLQAGRSGVFDHIARYHAHRLRGFVKGGVGSGRTRRASRPITLHWAVGALGIIGVGIDAQGLQFDQGWFGLIQGVGPDRRGYGMKQAERNERTTHRRSDPWAGERRGGAETGANTI
ncbi:hypothetical protein D3C76_1186140 [compost metagenome]